jgi:hypothetical protein
MAYERAGLVKHTCKNSLVYPEFTFHGDNMVYVFLLKWVYTKTKKDGHRIHNPHP